PQLPGLTERLSRGCVSRFSLVFRCHSYFRNRDCSKWDMMKFTSAMLDAIEHCAKEAQIDVEWRSVCVGDIRDAYDLLTRKLARDGTARVQAKGTEITMALDGNIGELQQLLADGAPESVVAEKLQMIVTAIGHLRE